MAGKAYGTVPFPTNGLDDATLAKFNGALIDVRTGSKPISLTDPATGQVVARRVMRAALQCDGNGQNCVLDPAVPAGAAFRSVAAGKMRASFFPHRELPLPQRVDTGYTEVDQQLTAGWVRIWKRDMPTSLSNPTWSTALVDFNLANVVATDFAFARGAPAPGLMSDRYFASISETPAAGVPCFNNDASGESMALRGMESVMISLTLNANDTLDYVLVSTPLNGVIKPFALYDATDGL